MKGGSQRSEDMKRQMTDDGGQTTVKTDGQRSEVGGRRQGKDRGRRTDRDRRSEVGDRNGDFGMIGNAEGEGRKSEVGGLKAAED